MKHLKILKLLFIAILILNLSCSKDDGNDTKSDQTIEEELLDVYTLQYELNNQFLNTIKDFTDEIEHQDAVLEWIKQRPDVLEVEMYDFTYYTIKHITGITTVVSFIKEAKDHASATRGGGFTDGTLRQYVSKTNKNGENIITNKNVLVLCPFVCAMYDGDRVKEGRRKKISDIKDQFDEANLDFKVTYKINEDADVEAFSDLEDYGFIIVATHGSTTGVQVSETFVPKDGEKMTEPSKANLAPIDKKNKELINSRYLNPTLRTVYSTEGASRDAATGFEITFPYFATLGLKMDNSILYGGFCYSGYKGGLLGQALEPQGLKVYYGFGYGEKYNGESLAITNIASWDAEKVIIDNLTKDGDSTGVAHLIDNVKILTDTTSWNDMPKSLKRRLEKFDNITGPQPLLQWLAKDYFYEVCVNENDPFTTATISGLDTGPSFTANTFTGEFNKNGTVLLEAVSSGIPGQTYNQTLSLGTTKYTGVGTYKITGTANLTTGGWFASLNTDPNSTWNSYDGSSGDVTITADCETYIEGTFSFPLKNRGSTEIQVTSGKFLIFY